MAAKAGNERRLHHVAVRGPSKIDKRGVLGKVCGPEIHCTARGVHIAIQYLAHSIEARLSRRADENDCIDIRIILQLSHFHRGRHIKQNNDLVKVLLCKLDHLLLIIIQFQLVLAFRIVIVPVGHIPRQVAAFTAAATDHYNGRIAVFRKAVNCSAGVALNRHLTDIIGRITRVVHCDLGTCMAFIAGISRQEIKDCGVDLEPCIFQSRLYIDCRAHIHRTGAGATINGVCCITSQKCHFCTRVCKGKNTIVLQQYNAL